MVQLNIMYMFSVIECQIYFLGTYQPLPIAAKFGRCKISRLQKLWNFR